MTLAVDLITMADQDVDFLNKIFTGDETWCFFLTKHHLNVSNVSENPTNFFFFF
jgi:hypothetical protein